MQLTLHGDSSEDPARLRSAMTDALRHATEMAESCARTAREVIAARRRVALENLRQLVSRRVAIEEAVVAAKVNLGIPLTADPNASPVPIRPVGLNLDRAIRRAENEGSALALDAGVREQILSTIRAFGRALERLPITAKRLAELDEEALRDVLLFVINANWQLATGEAFSGEGKTDIQLQFDGRVAFMAELKLYSGPKAVRQAIDQVSGYMVWRDTHAALVMFIKDRRNVSAVITQIRGAIESHDRFIAQVPVVEDAYTFATNDDLRTIILDLIAVPL